MITVDTIGRVRRAYFVQGRKIKAIARELKMARNTVRDIVRAEEGRAATERGYHRAVQPLPRLGAYVDILEQILADNAKRPKRERLTYQRIFGELMLAGYTGGYDAVRRYARVWAIREGERRAEAFVPLRRSGVNFRRRLTPRSTWRGSNTLHTGLNRCGAEQFSLVPSSHSIRVSAEPPAIHDITSSFALSPGAHRTVVTR